MAQILQAKYFGSGRLTAKQAVSPGFTSWMCPDTAFSLTPLSMHPHLPLLVTRLIDGYTSLKVVHAAEHQVHPTTITRQVS